LEELQGKIEEMQARADMHYQANPKVIEDYERRRIEIERLEQELEGERTRIEAQRHEIRTIQEEWEPVVERLVARISHNLSAAMQTIGCQGSVRLGMNCGSATPQCCS
jgi:chromosome segregation ATPase